MTWYNTGTVSVTNGSAVVTGSGTAWTNYVDEGQGFKGPDGKIYEIASVDSATQLTLATSYSGVTQSGQPYSIAPVQGYLRKLSQSATSLLLTYEGFDDRLTAVESGKASLASGPTFTGASLAIAPPTTSAQLLLQGSGFAGAQTYSLRQGVVGLSNGGFSVRDETTGITRIAVSPSGQVSLTGYAPRGQLNVLAPDPPPSTAAGVNTLVLGEASSTAGYTLSAGMYYSGGWKAAIDALAGGVGTSLILQPSGGAIGVGTANPLVSLHLSRADQAQARVRLQNTGAGGRAYDLVAGIHNISQAGFSLLDATTEATRLVVDPNGNLLVGLTSNSGLHQFVKNGTAAGNAIFQVDNGSAISVQVQAVDANAFNGGAAAAMWIGANMTSGRSICAGGTINASGADYAEYMRKSASCGEIAKGEVCGVNADGDLTRAWAEAVSFVVKSTDPSYVGGDTWGRAEIIGERPEAPDYGALDEEDRESAEEAYETALAEWTVRVQTERAKVDRIAFCGQVPCNVTGSFSVGDYIVAEQDGEGILAVAVPDAEITFAQYKRRIGKVWAIREGRAWINVQHG